MKILIEKENGDILKVINFYTQKQFDNKSNMYLDSEQIQIIYDKENEYKSKILTDNFGRYLKNFYPLLNEQDSSLLAIEINELKIAILLGFDCKHYELLKLLDLKNINAFLLLDYNCTNEQIKAICLYYNMVFKKPIIFVSKKINICEDGVFKSYKRQLSLKYENLKRKRNPMFVDAKIYKLIYNILSLKNN